MNDNINVEILNNTTFWACVYRIYGLCTVLLAAKVALYIILYEIKVAFIYILYILYESDITSVRLKKKTTEMYI